MISFDRISSRAKKNINVGGVEIEVVAYRETYTDGNIDKTMLVIITDTETANMLKKNTNIVYENINYYVYSRSKLQDNLFKIILAEEELFTV